MEAMGTAERQDPSLACRPGHGRPAPRLPGMSTQGCGFASHPSHLAPVETPELMHLRWDAALGPRYRRCSEEEAHVWANAGAKGLSMIIPAQ